MWRSEAIDKTEFVFPAENNNLKLSSFTFKKYVGEGKVAATISNAEITQ